MATTKISDLIEKQVVADIAANLIEKKSSFMQMGVIAGASVDISAGNFCTFPSWNPLAAPWQKTPSSDSDGELTVNNVSTHSVTLPIMRRAVAYGVFDTARLSSGQDPNGYVAGKLATDAALMIDTAIAATVQGALPDQHIKKHATGTFSVKTLVSDLTAVLGDHFDSIGAIGMHSAIYATLIEANIVSFPVTSDPTETSFGKYGRVLGITVHVSDRFAHLNDGTNDFAQIYLIARESIIMDYQRSLNVDTEFQALRKREVLAADLAFTTGLQNCNFKSTAINPDDAALSTATNWEIPSVLDMDELDDRKNVPIVCSRWKL